MRVNRVIADIREIFNRRGTPGTASPVYQSIPTQQVRRDETDTVNLQDYAQNIDLSDASITITGQLPSFASRTGTVITISPVTATTLGTTTYSLVIAKDGTTVHTFTLKVDVLEVAPEQAEPESVIYGNTAVLIGNTLVVYE